MVLANPSLLTLGLTNQSHASGMNGRDLWYYTANYDIQEPRAYTLYDVWYIPCI